MNMMADSMAVSVSWEKGAPSRSGKQFNLRATAGGEF